MTESSLSWKHLYIMWLILAILFGGIAFFVIKAGNLGYANVMTYALSAIIIAEMVYIVEKGEGSAGRSMKPEIELDAVVV